MQTGRLYLLAFVFLNLLASGIFVPRLNSRAQELGASFKVQGILAATFPLLQIFSAPFFGQLSDKRGRAQILFYLELGSSAAYFVASSAHTLGQLLVSRILSGLLGASQIAVSQAFIADITPQAEVPKYLGLMGVLFGLSFSIGPPIGGILSQNYGSKTPALAAGFVSLANIGVCALLMQHDPQIPRLLTPKKGKPSASATPHLSDIPDALRDPLMKLRFIFGCGFYLFRHCFGSFLTARFGVRPKQSGFYQGFMGVCTMIFQGVIVPRMSKRHEVSKLLRWANALMVIACLAWGLCYNRVLLPGVILLLAGASSFHLTLIGSAISAAASKASKGKIISLSQSVESTCKVVAPLIGGLVFDTFGDGGPPIVCALLFAALVLWKVPR